MEVTAKQSPPPAPANLDFGLPARQARLRLRDPEYMDVLEFLYDEAALLDEDRLDQWLELLSEDITYFMPVRANRLRKDGRGFSLEYGHFDENYASLTLRVRKWYTPSSWGEDPPSRTRRFLTNVRVYKTDRPDDYLAVSDLLVIRNRLNNVKTDILAAERRDLVRRAQDGRFKLAGRRILLDQATVPTANLAILL
jgi:3-phenylpropionate/cinnamic acid dioxygenase small subunit